MKLILLHGRCNRNDPTATVPNLYREFARKFLCLRERFVVITAFENGGRGENLASFVDRIEPIVDQDITPTPESSLLK